MATASLNNESSKQRVLREMTRSFKAGMVFCVYLRGEVGGGGGWGDRKDKKLVAACYITKLKGRSGETRNSYQKDQRKTVLCNMPVADRQAALALHLS